MTQKDLTENQLSDLETFMENEGSEIGETVGHLLDLYGKEPYISEVLFEAVVDELQEWWRFFQKNTEWETHIETIEYKTLNIL